MHLPSRTNELLYANFVDPTSISVGTTTGYRLYKTYPFEMIRESDEREGGIRIAEAIPQSSVIGIVASRDHTKYSPRQLVLKNLNPDKKSNTLSILNFVTPIVNVRMNSRRLILVMETVIHIFSIRSQKIVQSISTPLNREGICALSPNKDNCLLAYPSSKDSGEISIYDAIKMEPHSVIRKAHDAPIATMAFNSKGTLLATVSTSGTIIRVHTAKTGEPKYHMRRGRFNTKVTCLAFSRDSKKLAVSSTSSTVHVFNLNSTKSIKSDTLAKRYLPASMANVVDVPSSDARARLPEPKRASLVSDIPKLCSFSSTGEALFVLSGDGSFHHFNVIPTGEMRRNKHHLLYNPEED